MRPQTFAATLATSNKEVVIRWRPESHLPAAWAVYSSEGDPLGLFAIPGYEGWRTECPSRVWASRPALVTEDLLREIDKVVSIRDTTEKIVSEAVMDGLVSWVRGTHTTLDRAYWTVGVGSALEQARIGPDETRISMTEFDSAMWRAGWLKSGSFYEKLIK